MDYNKLLIELSTKENVSIEEFIESVVLLINNRLYIV